MKFIKQFINITVGVNQKKVKMHWVYKLKIRYEKIFEKR